MTTYGDESVVCGACGRVFTAQVLHSTNTVGYPDLDMRPPGMKRWTMSAWVQRCPSCGFCASDAAKFDERSRAKLDSADYQLQLADACYPELANSFVCSGWLAHAAGEKGKAAWEYLHVAWVLEDERQDDLAKEWRGRAADQFTSVLAEGKPVIEQPGASEALVAECLRRAGRGVEALPRIEQALGQGEGVDANVQKILRFQQALIQQGDTSHHRTDEVMNPG
jgi:uncharacterized protein (DUF2225 family)